MWKIASFVPLPKPRKDLTTIEGYRPIALLAPFSKLIDKLLYFRINRAVKEQTQGCQFGGNASADEAVWLLLEVLGIYASKLKSRLWLAFIDGESAYTRPPPEFILIALWAAGVRGTEWLLLDGILGKLVGNLKVGPRTYGSWRVECGVPQGGLLSMSLFAILLVQLEAELRAATVEYG